MLFFINKLLKKFYFIFSAYSPDYYSSPNFQVKFDFTTVKDSFTNIQNDQIEFKPYNRLNKANQKVSSILKISSYRYKLKFNGKLIPFTDKDELLKHFIDLNRGSDHSTSTRRWI